MKKEKVLIYILAGTFALLLTFCSPELPGTQAVAGSPWRNVYDSVAYVGMATCRSCHAGIHATFVHTGMGRSLGLATPQRSDASFGAHARVYDAKRDLYYYPFFRDSVMWVREFRLDARTGDTLHQRLEKIDYIIGSGHHTNSHLISQNGYLFQAPITYYTQQKRWDLAPGFSEFNERFGRLLSEECITCHNHYPQLAPGSLHKYTAMPTGIECERCHGPGQLHVKEKLAGIIVDTAAGPDYSIVNPRRLPRDLQMDLCQRCHLQGVAVLEEGKGFFDFRPGMRLNEVLNVYLPRFTNSHEKFIMASQADRLRQSACYQRSEMTCITCHNPHQSIREQGLAPSNRACQQCHQGKAGQPLCKAPAAELKAQDHNCVHCHMPPSGSTDIPHINITDHYISATNIRGRNTAKSTPTKEHPAFLGLQILTKDAASPLDLARAYMALYDRYNAEPYVLDSAAYYLAMIKDPGQLVYQTRVHHAFARANYAAVATLAANRQPAQESDAWTAYRIGESFLLLSQPEAALPWLQRATQLMPLHLDFQEKRASALIDLQRLDEAEKAYRDILSENEKRPVAWLNIGYLHALRARYDDALRAYERALALDPDYQQALINKAAIMLIQQNTAAARRLLQQVVRLNPQNVQATSILTQLGG